jgi:hypothetical protein
LGDGSVIFTTNENLLGWMPFPFVAKIYIFSAMRSFALRALGLSFISSSEGVIGFLFTSFSVALRSSS